MLDRSLCDRPSSEWIELKIWLRQMLAMPLRTIPVLLLLAVAPWGLPRLNAWWKGGLCVLASLPLLMYVLLPLSPILHLAERGLTAWLPADVGEPVDAIVVLGRGRGFRRSRVEIAQQLWESKRAPRIFTSGRGDGSAMRKGLIERGVPTVVLGAEDCSQTTEENARFTAAELQPLGVRSIVLVTDAPHMLRSVLTFRSVGFEVWPSPAPMPVLLPRRGEALLVVQEYLGFVVYGLRGRYWPGRNPQLESITAVESHTPNRASVTER